MKITILLVFYSLLRSLCIYIKQINITNFITDNAKDELRKTDNLSDEYRVLLDSIDNDAIIKSLKATIILLSWIGIIIDIIYILTWFFDDTQEKE